MNLKLSYFDFPSGRGEPARIMLTMAGIPFVDDRIPFSEWPKKKSGMPLGALPVLEVDGVMLTQSNTINRFLAKMCGMYPEHDWQAALCDEAMDTIEDATVDLVNTFGLQGDALKAARQTFMDESLDIYLGRIGQQLEERGDYICDGRFTVADLKIFVFTRSLCAGKLDHVPTTYVADLSPALMSHLERIGNEPGVKAFYGE